MNRLNDLRIEPVHTKRHQRDFFRVKRDLYRNDPAAVIPLRHMEWAFLNPNRHPFYLHAEREVFVAYQGSRPVGRIAAIVDRLHNQYYGDRTGFFGFFESPNEPGLATGLLSAAANWLADRNCQTIRGPMNPSMKGEFGVLVDGHQRTPRVMMAHTPRYYDELLRQANFKVVKRFFAYDYDIDADLDWEPRYGRIKQITERIQSRFPELKLETATRENVVQKLIEINTIGNKIRSVGWGFVPLTPEELDYMVTQLKRVIRPEMVVSAYYHSKLVGYVVTVPDVNWAIKRTRGWWDWLRMIQLPFLLPRIRQCRLIAIGVDPEFRKKGILTCLTKRMFDCGLEFRQWEFGWIAEDNLPSISALASSLPLVPCRTYQVYEKPI